MNYPLQLQSSKLYELSARDSRDKGCKEDVDELSFFIMGVDGKVALLVEALHEEGKAAEHQDSSHQQQQVLKEE
eukprot:CAMPEP_0170545250 /NCGR_PEP_ID=MMETSP0211-20121228/3710_1 /TAXON_ID=311385 /ORGANISM="Pseudokeronopsis sp., Strain OXSARD2" /LENGTH=73 /DNA_ID=CAMNT_0010849105 /DNA_START=244 /DNA_END=465 /DNA_ORIENTATION=+